jgi:hypothetical protein
MAATTTSRTGGGRGTNQYAVKGRSIVDQRAATAALVEPEARAQARHDAARLAEFDWQLAEHDLRGGMFPVVGETSPWPRREDIDSDGHPDEPGVDSEIRRPAQTKQSRKRVPGGGDPEGDDTKPADGESDDEAGDPKKTKRGRRHRRRPKRGGHSSGGRPLDSGPGPFAAMFELIQKYVSKARGG